MAPTKFPDIGTGAGISPEASTDPGQVPLEKPFDANGNLFKTIRAKDKNRKTEDEPERNQKKIWNQRAKHPTVEIYEFSLNVRLYYYYYS